MNFAPLIDARIQVGRGAPSGVPGDQGGQGGDLPSEDDLGMGDSYSFRPRRAGPVPVDKRLPAAWQAGCLQGDTGG